MKLIKILKYYFHILLLMFLNIKTISYHHKYFFIKLKNNTVFKIRNFMDLWTLTETYLNSDYEKHGDKLGVNWTIIDIGAAFGDFSVFAAQKSSLNQIIAIEPLPSSQRLFRQNIRMNKLKNIIIFSGGISSTQNKINIAENNKNYGHSQTSSTSSFCVDAISLPKLFSKYNLKHCHLIKCDCEGTEYDIFSNVPSSIYAKIDRIVMEYHLFDFDSQQKFQRLKSIFKKNNYRLKISPNPVHSNLGFLYAFRKN
ncbi:MAG: FkbM family methyltransferase [Candidatus Shapirobacteria bacterium]|nr:FkbM family methyltransferase [Candidatus Shapirobacteria bacterium]